MEIVKTELLCGLVSQFDQFDDIRGDDRPDLLTRQPGLFPFVRVGGGFEDILNPAVGNFFAVDSASKDAKVLFDFNTQVNGFLEQFRFYLVVQVAVVQDVELACEERVLY